MKAVLISIRPEWCMKIANGEKTVEVRRTKPKTPVPFKAYIYCTQGGDRLWLRDAAWRESWKNAPISFLCNAESCGGMSLGNGSVIGEFVCDQIIVDRTFGHDEKFYKAACLSACDAAAYAVQSPMYGWRISNLKIYDSPRELTSFVKPLVLEKVQPYTWYVNKERYLTRAPQSWCYVEDAE